MPEKLYTKMQAAEYLQCSLSTINRRIKTGDLKPLKNGRIVRFTESELERFVHDSNQSDPAEPMPVEKETAPLPDSWKKQKGVNRLKIRYSKQALKFLAKQENKVVKRIRQGIAELANKQPTTDVKPMQGKRKKDGDMRLRIGSFRVIYNYDEENGYTILLVLKIDNRGDIYK